MKTVNKLSPEQAKKMAIEYLESNLSAKEIGAKYGVSAPNVIYHARKVRNANGDKSGT